MESRAGIALESESICKKYIALTPTLEKEHPNPKWLVSLFGVCFFLPNIPFHSNSFFIIIHAYQLHVAKVARKIHIDFSDKKTVALNDLFYCRP